MPNPTPTPRGNDVLSESKVGITTVNGNATQLDDFIYGDNGDDTIYGQDGSDHLSGEMAMILYMEVMGMIIYKVDLATIRSTEEMVMISWLVVQVQISSIVDLEMM